VSVCVISLRQTTINADERNERDRETVCAREKEKDGKVSAPFSSHW